MAEAVQQVLEAFYALFDRFTWESSMTYQTRWPRRNASQISAHGFAIVRSGAVSQDSPKRNLYWLLHASTARVTLSYYILKNTVNEKIILFISMSASQPMNNRPPHITFAFANFRGKPTVALTYPYLYRPRIYQKANVRDVIVTYLLSCDRLSIIIILIMV